MSYCHINVSVMRRPSTVENKYSNIFFYKTTGPTVLNFHMEHDARVSDCKFGWGRISKIAAVTENSKNNKINFFSRTTGYFWLDFGMENLCNTGSINKKMTRSQEPLVEIDLTLCQSISCLKLFGFFEWNYFKLCELTIQDGRQGSLLKIA